MKYMERYVVVYKWGESYKNPIILKKDEKVIVDLTREADTEWENWVWCISGGGMKGWVPTQILNECEVIPNDRQIAIALEDYSAYELPVNQDEIVIGSRFLNGWLWCQKENSIKEGWVPIRCLKRLIY